MVIRDNQTWEQVGQQLDEPLLAGTTYRFSIFLGQSQYYIAQSRTTHQEVNYVGPTVLRIYGGNDACTTSELLAESPPIQTVGWDEYIFEFTPTKNWNHLVLAAYYDTNQQLPYNGHIMVDNCSALEKISATDFPNNHN